MTQTGPALAPPCRTWGPGCADAGNPVQVDLGKVHIDVLRPWVTKKVCQYVGMEDDIIINMVMAELENADDENADPRRIQINVTGFLERNAGAFMAELWKLLISAHGNTLRALVKHLDDIPEDVIANLNIPTSVPLVYELDENLKPIKHAQAWAPMSGRYLGDQEVLTPPLLSFLVSSFPQSGGVPADALCVLARAAPPEARRGRVAAGDQGPDCGGRQPDGQEVERGAAFRGGCVCLHGRIHLCLVCWALALRCWTQ